MKQILSELIGKIFQTKLTHDRSYTHATNITVKIALTKLERVLNCLWVLFISVVTDSAVE